jgi:hypothetical protein
MKYIGNCSDVINIPVLLDYLSKQTPRSRGNEQPDDIHSNPKVQALKETWEEAGYDAENGVWWLDYTAPKDVAEKFSEFVGVKLLGGWITCVPPGFCVPWHYDITDDETEYLKMGQPVRYTCHLSTPSFGQAFMLEDHVFYNELQGNVYRWDDWQQWHGGINMGLESKFLYNFLGIIPHE